MPEQENSLRHVPSVDQLLRTEAARELRGLVGLKRLTNIARAVTAEIRSLIRHDPNFLKTNGNHAELLLAEAVKRLEASARRARLWTKRLDTVQSNTISRTACAVGVRRESKRC